MNCLELERLEAYLAGGLPADESASIKAHLEACESCRRDLDEASQNLQLLSRVRRTVSVRGESKGDSAKTFGRYRILRELGRGGMGVVYLAEQTSPRREVALKVVLPGVVSTEALGRFRLESQILGRLQHPGIAGIYEAGIQETEHGGSRVEQAYFAMEYVPGERLDEYVRIATPTLRQRLGIWARICDAVHHAHTRGVVHRDLKPGNIIIRESTGDGGSGEVQPKILDFGVARSLESDLRTVTLQTEVGRILGTVPFMSPEQVSGDPSRVDTRSDVYSLGVLGYWLLTGNLPYELQGRALPEAARIIQDDDPTSASTHNAQLKGDLDTILAKVLEKDPDRRYGSASELALDVRRFLSDEPVAARPPGTWYQFSKFARRNRGLVATLAALFLVTAAGAILATALAIRSNRAEQLARAEEEKAQREATTATAINDFLLRILASADPYAEWGDRDIKVADALVLAAARLDSGQLAGQPETELAVRHTVGNAFRTLGDYEAAERQFERALFVHDSAFGEMDARAIGARNDLAAVYAEQGRFADAERIARQSLAASRRAGTIEDEIGSLGNLAAFLAEQGDYVGAESTMVQNIARIRNWHGDEHSELALNLSNLGVVRARLGMYTESRKALDEAFAIQRTAAGDLHPLTLTVRYALCRTMLASGDSRSAEAELQDLLQVGVNVLGHNHPDVCAIRASFVQALARNGRFDEADSVLAEALAPYAARADEADPVLAGIQLAAGELDFALGRFEGADRAYATAESMYRTVYGDGHTHVANVLQARGDLAARLEDFALAESRYAEALEIRERCLGPDNILTQQTRDSLLRLRQGSTEGSSRQLP